jgi:hypothetical protein
MTKTPAEIIQEKADQDRLIWSDAIRSLEFLRILTSDDLNL